MTNHDATYTETLWISKITSVKNGTDKTFADAVLYAPFGGIASFIYAAGLTEVRNYDLMGRLTYLKSGPFLKKEYSYDPNGNITAIADLVNSARNQTFTYDALNRLVSATGAYGSFSYEYDAVGNRTKKTENGVETIYSYIPGTNKLAPPYEYDANGNMTSDGKYTYEYEAGVPFPFAGGDFVINPYIYTGGNPVNFIDPQGLIFGDKLHAYLENRIEENFQKGFIFNAAVDAVALSLFGENDLDLALAIIPIGKIKLVGEGVLEAKLLGKALRGGKLCKEAIEGHHLLPVKYRDYFAEAGLNIDDYIVPLERGTHRLKDSNGLHTLNNALGKRWEDMWEPFIEKYPNPTPADKQKILKYMNKLRGLYGI